MTNKHTPGPWGVKGWRVTIPGTGEVTLAAPGVTTATADANARLISAAPELLAALEWALKNLEEIAIPEFEFQGRVTSMNEAAIKARAAIAKAKGAKS